MLEMTVIRETTLTVSFVGMRLRQTRRFFN
nr:MAG TPA: hypothetical protein [Caudoviricetes sp.]